jgi:hypothetical protein
MDGPQAARTTAASTMAIQRLINPPPLHKAVTAPATLAGPPEFRVILDIAAHAVKGWVVRPVTPTRRETSVSTQGKVTGSADLARPAT